MMQGNPMICCKWSRFISGICLTACWLMIPDPAYCKQSEHPMLADYFGFDQIQIIPADAGIGRLVCADFDQNHYKDLAVVNYKKSRIDLFLRKKDPLKIQQGTPSDPFTEDINELPGSRLFEKHSILITVRPSSLIAGDFNSDGKIDLAFYGDPSGLYLILQKGTAGSDLQWEAIRKIEIENGLNRPKTLLGEDLNQDGKEDLLLAGKNNLYLLFQDSNGTLAEPEKIPLQEKVFEIHHSDLNGDNIKDLCFLSDHRQRPIQVRFGKRPGQYGPLVDFKSDPPISLQLANLDNDSANELLFIEKKTGRLYGMKLIQKSQNDESDQIPQTKMHPVSSDASASKYELACGDFTGSGQKDIVISRFDTAQILFYKKSDSAGFVKPVPFPAYSEITKLKAADVDLQGPEELIVLSTKERAIGVSRFKNGRFTFPQALDVIGEPVCMDAADIDGDDFIECVYISRNQEDQRILQVYEFSPDGTQSVQSEPILLKNVLANPAGLKILDVNADDLPDVLVFLMYDEPILLIQQADHTFSVAVKASSNAGLIKAASETTVQSVDLDSDGKTEVLIAEGSYARQLLFQNGKWKILDQFNAASRGDRILLAGAFDIDGDQQAEILLLDSRRNQLQILSRGQDQTYRPEHQIPIGTWNAAGHLQMLYETFEPEGDQFLLFDGSKFAMLSLSQESAATDWQLESLFNYETSIRDGRYTNLTSGDLNRDGQLDLVLVENRKNHLDILTFPPDSVLPIPATRFRVFEEKNYQEARTRAASEPRELLIEDLDNDGDDDLVAILHDRIIIYPQDY